MLLGLISIWIYKKYKELAIRKGFSDKAKLWGWKGVGIYIGSSIGFGFLVGVLIALDLFYIDLDSSGVNILFNLVGFAIGGLVTSIVYQNHKNRDDIRPDVSSFGRDDNGMPTFEDDLDE